MAFLALRFLLVVQAALALRRWALADLTQTLYLFSLLEQLILLLV